MKRQFPDSTYNGLKAATRRLLCSAGGLDAASEVTRLNRSQLGNCQNINSDQFLPIDAVADLSRDTGDRVVLRALQRTLKDVGLDGDVSLHELNKDIMTAHREGAEAIQAGMEALDDDVLELHELRRIIKESDDAINAFQKVRDRAARRLDALGGA